MRFYFSVKEALYETERDLVEMGVDVATKSMQNLKIESDPAFDTKEVVGYGLKIVKCNSSEAIKSVADFYKEDTVKVAGYLVAESSDRGRALEGINVNPGKAYLYRPEVWEKFLIKGNRGEKLFDYTYADRIASFGSRIVETLNNDPYSRQAVINIWRGDDLLYTRGRRRIPCSLTYQFLVRHRGNDTVMNVIYSMRSCDLYTHFGYDVALAIMMAEQVIMRVNSMRFTSVDLTMFVGSLHAYRKDYEPRGVF